MQALIGWQRVRVAGNSMTPTLLPGDWLLVRHGARVRPGLIVLARFRSRPDLVVLKRAVAETADGWLLSSDNPGAGSDSRQYGPADVQAVAIWQWCRGAGLARSRWSRWCGRRPAAAPEL
ncbi:MAG TPA: S24 family peptidase [Jatrophihabitans sp.]|nr:S24 family peptidase [Jatrophihabitans sp.]